MSHTPPPTGAPDEAGDQVAPHRAAQRLYDEMAHAYHEQRDLDLEIAEAFSGVTAESLALEED